MLPTLDLRSEENTTGGKWNWSRSVSGTELLKLRKRGQFPDDPVRIKFSQISYVTTQTFLGIGGKRFAGRMFIMNR